MGFIEKRAGRFRARHRGPDGKERSRTFDRKVDAERWLTTQSADVLRGQWTDPTLGRMTFGAWVRVWDTGFWTVVLTLADLAGWRYTALITSTVGRFAVRSFVGPSNCGGAK